MQTCIRLVYLLNLRCDLLATTLIRDRKLGSALHTAACEDLTAILRAHALTEPVLVGTFAS